VSGRKELGKDCSGLVCTVLRDLSLSWPLYDGQRRTAQGIYQYYHSRGIKDTKDLKPGTLVFFRRPGKKFHHVKIHLVTVPKTMGQPFGPMAVDAGGAGSDAVSPRRALERAAQVRYSASDKHGKAEWVAKDIFEMLWTEKLS
jgi:hypothetical protein